MNQEGIYKLIGLKNFNNQSIELLSIHKKPKDDLTDSEGLIILCELNQNEKGETIPRQNLYGIEFAKKLRKEGINIPIVFTSFLSRSQVYDGKLNRGIVNAIGHAFVQLPCKPEDWIQAADALEPLNELEMYDVVHNYCTDAGPIRMLFHALNGYPGDNLKEKIREAIEQSHSVFGQNASLSVAEFQDRYPQVTPLNKKAALDFAESIGNRLIEEFAPSEANNSVVKAEGKWKLLVLDDEIGETDDLIKRLKDREVMEIICVRTALEAEKAIKKDYHDEKRILMVLSDYRLENVIEGVKVHQPVQGYRFVAKQAKKMPHIRFAALSGLPRKFLMQSFKHYGVRVDVFSKKDYLENEATLNILCDEIIDIGNENAKAIARLPGITSKGWELFVPFYFAHRNSTNYKDNERDISALAKEYCEGIKSGKYLSQLEGYSVALKGKKKVPSNTKAFDEFLSKMICRRVAIWYSQYNKGWTIQDVHRVVLGKNYSRSVKETTAKNQINTNLALALKDYPWNMTIEEKYWMIYEMGYTEIDEIERQEEEILATISDALNKWLADYGFEKKLKNDISFKRFYSGKIAHFGLNFSTLKQFLYQLYKHILGNDDAIVSLQNQIIGWKESFKEIKQTSENTRQLPLYLEMLRKRLMTTKSIDRQTKVNIDGKSDYLETIVTATASQIARYELEEFNATVHLFFSEVEKISDQYCLSKVLLKTKKELQRMNEDERKRIAKVKLQLKTKEDWISALVAYHKIQMDDFKNLGLDFEEWMGDPDLPDEFD